LECKCNFWTSTGDGIYGVIETIRQQQNKIKFVLVRHEESAAFMACAYAKYTGKLGVCLATSGSGAIHLLTGLYDAKLDNTPVIAYVDPFEPPMPPKLEREFITNLAESFAKGQPYARRIGLTLFRNQVHETLKGLHSHSDKKHSSK
jgi:hypothetical protein